MQGLTRGVLGRPLLPLLILNSQLHGTKRCPGDTQSPEPQGCVEKPSSSASLFRSPTLNTPVRDGHKIHIESVRLKTGHSCISAGRQKVGSPLSCSSSGYEAESTSQGSVSPGRPDGTIRLELVPGLGRAAKMRREPSAPLPRRQAPVLCRRLRAHGKVCCWAGHAQENNVRRTVW